MGWGWGNKSSSSAPSSLHSLILCEPLHWLEDFFFVLIKYLPLVHGRTAMFILDLSSRDLTLEELRTKSLGVFF